MKQWPKHLPPQRDFKRDHRAAIKRVLKALEDVRYGCAYSPAEEQIIAAIDLLEAAKDSVSVEKWGR